MRQGLVDDLGGDRSDWHGAVRLGSFHLMELQDFIGEAIALIGVALLWLQTNRARQKERETRAEERGAFQQWRDSVNARLESRRDEYEKLKDQIATDHSGLRARVDEGFGDTDTMLDGIKTMVLGMRGELRGAGVLGKD